MMVMLHAIVPAKDYGKIPKMSLCEVLKRIAEKLGEDPEWKPRSNRNTIALAALHATLCRAPQGSSIVEDDVSYVHTLFRWVIVRCHGTCHKLVTCC